MSLTFNHIDKLVLLLIQAAGGCYYSKMQAEKIMDIFMENESTSSVEFLESLKAECGRQVIARALGEYLDKKIGEAS